ncbi:uncharacterized protein LOC130677406 [Microplitis mediator]|uniref:uncharacterized protein LOC130677406 n=1 Tax=Microplitis mediator TaxID=375433 RepID=UPI0025554065|nr:uncharacterized protein LOC130677406 [Microplitis mediator]XP_057340140.1 uncharacterized protein LOC130677406 [Microplitis mediator]
MAALFKVARYDKPSKRKIIRAATIDGLISSARTKLKLTDENYKIYTEDFTDIDEDDILLELAHSKESRGEQLLLTIVPDHILWNCNALDENVSKSSAGIHREISSSSTSHRPTEKSISSSSSSTLHTADDELSKFFSKFSTNPGKNVFIKFYKII